MLLPEYIPVVDLKRGNFVDQRFFGIATLYGFSGGKPVEKPFKTNTGFNYGRL